MTKATAVPLDQEEAYPKLAEQSARVPPGSTCTRRETDADGVPAVEQELFFVDDHLGGAFLRRELDHTFASLRFILIPALERYGRTFCHGGTQVSVHVPVDWEVREESEQQVRFYGPPWVNRKALGISGSRGSCRKRVREWLNHTESSPLIPSPVSLSPVSSRRM